MKKIIKWSFFVIFFATAVLILRYPLVLYAEENEAQADILVGDVVSELQSAPVVIDSAVEQTEQQTQTAEVVEEEQFIENTISNAPDFFVVSDSQNTDVVSDPLSSVDTAVSEENQTNNENSNSSDLTTSTLATSTEVYTEEVDLIVEYENTDLSVLPTLSDFYDENETTNIQTLSVTTEGETGLLIQEKADEEKTLFDLTTSTEFYLKELKEELEIPVIYEKFIVDKNLYISSDMIVIDKAPQGSAIEIYWLDDPDTGLNPDLESQPSNVYAVAVGDNGHVEIDVATLPLGSLVLVNTFEQGYCSGLYLSQCREQTDYISEVSIRVMP